LGFGVLIGLLAPAVSPGAPAPGIQLAPARLDSANHMMWRRSAVPVPAAAESLRTRLLSALTAADSAACLTRAAADSVLRPAVLRRLAMLALAHGDSARADSAWTELMRSRSPWMWEAARSRADLAKPRFADPVSWARFADSLLAGLDLTDGTALETSAWRLRRAEARALLGDTSGAVAQARSALMAAPAQPPASAALERLGLWMPALGARLDAAEERAAAETEFAAGRRAPAVERMARAIQIGDSSDAGPAIRRSEMLRAMRRFDAAHATLDAATQRIGAETQALLLERARVLRDAARSEAAFTAYRRAALTEGRARETAWWELGRAADLARRPALADTADLAVESLGGPLAAAAVLRRITREIAGGRTPEIPESTDEGLRLWRGFLDRTLGAGDSTLAMLSARPGYTYPRATARETLKTEAMRRAPAAPGSLGPLPGLAGAAALLHAGLLEEGAVVLDRALASGNGVAKPGAPALLAAAALYYGAERWGAGVRCVRMALDAAGPDSLRAAIGPWLYPPAHPEWFAQLPATPDSDGIDRALVKAVAWQESKFDPRAVSRSNALGVLQLKQPTAADMARLARERVPSEADLFVPEISLRLGVRYFRRLVRRFHGSVPLALGAYNAGPTGARVWDRGPAAPWGDALTLERVPAGQTHDYAKIILAVRSAYRELAPYVE